MYKVLIYSFSSGRITTEAILEDFELATQFKNQLEVLHPYGMIIIEREC